MGKRSYASIEGVEGFGENFFRVCEPRSVRSQGSFFIGDGANWIRRLKENYFPETIGVLDIWHLERELKRALGEEKSSLIEVSKGFALSWRGSEILQGLMKEGAKVKAMEERKKIMGAMSYVRSNLDWRYSEGEWLWIWACGENSGYYVSQEVQEAMDELV